MAQSDSMPVDREAERAVLGCCLMDSAAADDALLQLKEEDFTLAEGRAVFTAIQGLRDRGVATDMLAVSMELQRSGSDVSPAWVAGLTDAVVGSANAGHYIGLVDDCASRRRLIVSAREAIRIASDRGKPIEDAVGQVEEAIHMGMASRGRYLGPSEIAHAGIAYLDQAGKLKGKPRWITTGFRALDEYLAGFGRSELTIIGARPSVGKTALALNMAAEIGFREGHPVGFVSLEMPADAIAARLIAGETGIDGNKMRRGMLLPGEVKTAVEICGQIASGKLYLCDDDYMTMRQVRALANRLWMRHAIKALFIDYLTLIVPDDRNVPRWEQVGEMARSLKRLAKHLRIPIIALAQLGRDAEGRRPVLSDLRESGDIEQAADVVVYLHKPKPPKGEMAGPIERFEAIIAKNRNGPVGIVNMTYDRESTRFESAY